VEVSRRLSRDGHAAAWGRIRRQCCGYYGPFHGHLRGGRRPGKICQQHPNAKAASGLDGVMRRGLAAGLFVLDVVMFVCLVGYHAIVFLGELFQHLLVWWTTPKSPQST
jgi:hypothetical protein